MGLRTAEVVRVERILEIARRSADLMAVCSAMAWNCTMGLALCTASWISLVQRFTTSPLALYRCSPATSALLATTCTAQCRVAARTAQHGSA